MEREEAARVLGVPHDADVLVARAAYRRLLLRTHPDVSGDDDATDRTVRLTEAFGVLARTPAPARATAGVAPAGAGAPPDSGTGGDGPSTARDTPLPPEVTLVDHDTIGVAAPPDETLMAVVDTAHRLGDIAYLDPGAGLVEVVVEFVEAPTSSVLMSLQGRATGVTDVFCTVEPLSGGDAPPADAVTRLLLATMREVLGTAPPSPAAAAPPS